CFPISGVLTGNGCRCYLSAIRNRAGCNRFPSQPLEVRLWLISRPPPAARCMRRCSISAPLPIACATPGARICPKPSRRRNARSAPSTMRRAGTGVMTDERGPSSVATAGRALAAPRREVNPNGPGGLPRSTTTTTEVVMHRTCRTYRAAYWTDGRGAEVVLTLPAHADLPDDELRAEAQAEAERAGLDLSCGRIEIGEWHDPYAAED